MSSKEAKLNKLSLIAYSDEGFSSKVSEFSVLINPENYKHTHSVTYNERDSIGEAKGPLQYWRTDPEVLSFDLILDGTGLANKNTQSPKSVDEQLKKLKAVVIDYNGQIHSPNFVKVAWGSFEFKGRLESMDVEVTLFKSSGMPLRAKVAMSFKSHTDIKEAQRLAKKSSPDLSHLRLIKVGDTLPQLCYEIYKDPSYYVEVAAVNNITNFRELIPGSTVYFPPIKKS
ncbi:MAG: LysM peptidoglycan-binding domain-containing protein [Cytophagales bacterium]|nr:MAG: LysM peptidoglycan-binding domain-containing protein [Cytophagales bacterium]TAF61103.1 MAG: LysM peptidoglycan-binding domain-containing protein [Cytophagales bacterium]